MKKDQELVDACYRQLINPDFHVDHEGVTFSMPAKDMALIQSVGEKRLKAACKEALARKTAEDAAEIYGIDREAAYRRIKRAVMEDRDET